MFFYDRNTHESLWIHLHGLFSNVMGKKIEFLRDHFSQSKKFSFFAIDIEYERTTTTQVLDFLETLIKGFSLEYDRIVLCGSSHGAYVVSNYLRFKELGNVKEVVLLAPSFETLSLIKKHGGEGMDAWLEGKAELKIREKDREVIFSRYFAKDIVERGYEILDEEKVNFPENPPVEIKIVHGVEDEVIPVERTRLFVSKVRVKTYIEVNDDHRLDRTIEEFIRVII